MSIDDSDQWASRVTVADAATAGGAGANRAGDDNTTTKSQSALSICNDGHVDMAQELGLLDGKTYKYYTYYKIIKILVPVLNYYWLLKNLPSLVLPNPEAVDVTPAKVAVPVARGMLRILSKR